MENGKKTIQNKGLTASIVIPTYNRPQLAISLAKQIRGLYKEKYQIILIDQESKFIPDAASISELSIEYYNLPIANTSAAKNKGVQSANGDIVIFFDDDVEVTPKTITAHLSAYVNSKIMGVAGRVINDGEIVPYEAKAETGKSNFLATKFIYKFWSTKEQYVDFAYGCNMSFRKKTLESVGGFDLKFPKIFEEVDLSRRIKNGNNIIFVPEALVYHHKAKAGGIRKDEEQRETLIFKNYGYFISKHVPFPFSLITLILRTITALKHGLKPVVALYHGFFTT